MVNQLLVEKLTNVRDLIQSGWTQGSYAKDLSGNIVPVDDKRACCYCLVGACHKQDFFTAGALAACNKLRKPDLISWNDSPKRTKEEVIQFIEATIEKLNQEYD